MNWRQLKNKFLEVSVKYKNIFIVNTLSICLYRGKKVYSIYMKRSDDRLSILNWKLESWEKVFPFEFNYYFQKHTWLNTKPVQD